MYSRIRSAHFLGKEMSENPLSPSYNPTVFNEVYKKRSVNPKTVVESSKKIYIYFTSSLETGDKISLAELVSLIIYKLRNPPCLKCQMIGTTYDPDRDPICFVYRIIGDLYA